MRFEHVAIQVKDLDKAISILRDLLGMELVVRRTARNWPASTIELAFVANDLLTLELFEDACSSTSQESDGGTCFFHLGFSGIDLISQRAVASRMGLEIVHETVNEKQELTQLIIRAFDGLLLEFFK